MQMALVLFDLRLSIVVQTHRCHPEAYLGHLVAGTKADVQVDDAHSELDLLAGVVGGSWNLPSGDPLQLTCDNRSERVCSEVGKKEMSRWWSWDWESHKASWDIRQST
ncbi:unnamed protein product [Mesocestoides corti]|uniref:SRCR domain-containing protein n=1 Tax=Mesocestoides corti TaxID=53468 RepID=A0A0R3U198_MESCO|nr:unnamed protein product [Mesocestoides corti]